MYKKSFARPRTMEPQMSYGNVGILLIFYEL